MIDTAKINSCDKCFKLTGMSFKRGYKPVEYIHGRKNSQIWIVGLNPRGEIGDNDEKETIHDLLNSTFDNSYFRDFKNVSTLIYNAFSKENGVAHVDLVKCFSRSFPPVNLNKSELDEILCNCRSYLKDQLEIHKPKVIICNGSHVVWHIEKLIPPISDEYDYETFYIGNALNKPIIFRSGFIGRLDNYAKRRLGKEVENELIKNKIICA
jgi:uracil-DNA glycosylase